MSPPEPSSSTALLRRLAEGDRAAYDEFFPIVYAELHRLAQRLLDEERPDHTLQPTALVHEVYLRLVDEEDRGEAGRVSFFRVAARAMRRVLVESARRRSRDKRGGGRVRLPLDEGQLAEAGRGPDLIALDEALDALQERDATLAQMVELRFFGGLKHPEIAELLGQSLRQVERSWAFARAWLNRRLADESDDGG